LLFTIPEAYIDSEMGSSDGLIFSTFFLQEKSSRELSNTSSLIITLQRYSSKIERLGFFHVFSFNLNRNEGYKLEIERV
jgi:hypothetical protein